ncbi:hypothetical protein EXW58_21625 [Bacillus mycoides]|uniref:hypothetical protein n=1 Tax=Bacillus mycoides TaxID=1405 RepID=UPI001C01BE8A|nr:hypothetical protein [Bacillus mycoides]QWG30026.1 hypothetical protein EXW58_21625 [Bacillus mycoides]
MKSSKFIGLLFCVSTFMLLVGCNQKVLSFKGESENWIGSYKTQISEDSEDGAYVVKYKGENPEKIKVLNIVINDGESDFNGDGKALDENNELSFPKKCTDCLTTREDKEMIIDIKWDGHHENITLKKKD